MKPCMTALDVNDLDAADTQDCGVLANRCRSMRPEADSCVMGSLAKHTTVVSLDFQTLWPEACGFISVQGISIAFMDQILCRPTTAPL